MPNFCPRIIITDFEQAALNPFSNVYPDSEQRSCYFYLSNVYGESYNM